MCDWEDERMRQSLLDKALGLPDLLRPLLHYARDSVQGE